MAVYTEDTTKEQKKTFQGSTISEEWQAAAKSGHCEFIASQ